MRCEQFAGQFSQRTLQTEQVGHVGMNLRIGIAPHGQVALRVVSRQKDVFGGMAAAEEPEMGAGGHDAGDARHHVHAVGDLHVVGLGIIARTPEQGQFIIRKLDARVFAEQGPDLFRPRLEQYFFQPRSRAAHLRDIHIGRIESLGGVILIGPVAETQPRSAVVGHDDNGRPPVAAGEIERHAHGLVEGQHLGNHPHGVLGVRRHIDAAALNHQEKAVFMPVQHLQRLGRHLGQRRLFGIVPVEVVTHVPLREERPHGAFAVVGAERRGILLDKRRAAAAQIRPHGVRDLLPAAAEHHVQVVARHLRRQRGIGVAGVVVRSAGGGRRMAEIDRHDESRSLSPVVLGRFEQRRQRLTGLSGFDLDDILRGIGRRIDRNVARLLGHARHVGRHGRGRAGNRRIGREAPDQPAKAGIEVERPLRRVVVEFIPARRGEDARGGPVGNHHDDVAHRGDGFAVEGLRPGRQRGEEQKQQNCTFFHHNSLRFYGR